jgi:uracil-DNA glycosylase
MDARPDGTRTLGSLSELRSAVNGCRRCPLWRAATQGVPGEGDPHARIMLVGEQPGDVEDVKGLAFVGPAGAMLDRALHDAGLERSSLWITNAVKHFKYEQRGKRRLHKKPSIGETTACRWWLVDEMRLVRPRVIVAMGTTAARSLVGRPVTITAMRGTLHALHHSWLWVTIHPSSLLRMPDPDSRRAEYARFVADLKEVKAAQNRPVPRGTQPSERPGMAPSVRSGA